MSAKVPQKKAPKPRNDSGLAPASGSKRKPRPKLTPEALELRNIAMMQRESVKALVDAANSVRSKNAATMNELSKNQLKKIENNAKQLMYNESIKANNFGANNFGANNFGATEVDADDAPPMTAESMLYNEMGLTVPGANKEAALNIIDSVMRGGNHPPRFNWAYVPLTTTCSKNVTIPPSGSEGYVAGDLIVIYAIRCQSFKGVVIECVHADRSTNVLKYIATDRDPDRLANMFAVLYTCFSFSAPLIVTGTGITMNSQIMLEKTILGVSPTSVYAGKVAPLAPGRFCPVELMSSKTYRQDVFNADLPDDEVLRRGSNDPLNSNLMYVANAAYQPINGSSCFGMPVGCYCGVFTATNGDVAKAAGYDTSTFDWDAGSIITTSSRPFWRFADSTNFSEKKFIGDFKIDIRFFMQYQPIGGEAPSTFVGWVAVEVDDGAGSSTFIQTQFGSELQGWNNIQWDTSGHSDFAAHRGKIIKNIYFTIGTLAGSWLLHTAVDFRPTVQLMFYEVYNTDTYIVAVMDGVQSNMRISVSVRSIVQVRYQPEFLAAEYMDPRYDMPYDKSILPTLLRGAARIFDKTPVPPSGIDQEADTGRFDASGLRSVMRGIKKHGGRILKHAAGQAINLLPPTERQLVRGAARFAGLNAADFEPKLNLSHHSEAEDDDLSCLLVSREDCVQLTAEVLSELLDKVRFATGRFKGLEAADLPQDAPSAPKLDFDTYLDFVKYVSVIRKLIPICGALLHYVVTDASGIGHSPWSLLHYWFADKNLLLDIIRDKSCQVTHTGYLPSLMFTPYSTVETVFGVEVVQLAGGIDLYYDTATKIFFMVVDDNVHYLDDNFKTVIVSKAAFEKIINADEEGYDNVEDTFTASGIPTDTPLGVSSRQRAISIMGKEYVVPKLTIENVLTDPIDVVKGFGVQHVPAFKPIQRGDHENPLYTMHKIAGAPVCGFTEIKGDLLPLEVKGHVVKPEVGTKALLEVSKVPPTWQPKSSPLALSAAPHVPPKPAAAQVNNGESQLSNIRSLGRQDSVNVNVGEIKAASFQPTKVFYPGVSKSDFALIPVVPGSKLVDPVLAKLPDFQFGPPTSGIIGRSGNLAFIMAYAEKLGFQLSTDTFSGDVFKADLIRKPGLLSLKFSIRPVGEADLKIRGCTASKKDLTGVFAEGLFADGHFQEPNASAFVIAPVNTCSVRKIRTAVTPFFTIEVCLNKIF